MTTNKMMFSCCFFETKWKTILLAVYKMKIGFLKGINLIFSLFVEGDKVFSSLRSENDLSIRENFIYKNIVTCK